MQPRLRGLLATALLLGSALVLQHVAAEPPFVQTPAYLASAFRKPGPAALPSSTWKSIGPDSTTRAMAASKWRDPWGYYVDAGRVRGLLQDPDDLNRVYALFGGGGLWRSDNFYATPNGTAGDTHWKPLTDNLPGTNGGAMAFGCRPNILYLGMGDFDSSLLPSNNPATSVSGIIVKTLDRGETWGPPVLVSPSVSIIWDLDVIHGNPAVIPSGPPPPVPDGSQDKVIVSTDVGLFVSTDGARNFTRALPQDPVTQPNPIDNRADFYSVMRTSAGWIASGRLEADSRTSIFRSRDGITWDPTPVFIFPTTSRVSLYQARLNDPSESVVLANVAASNGSSWVDVYRSEDGGVSFTALHILVAGRVLNGPSSVAGNDLLECIGGQADYNQDMLIDPSDQSRRTFIWAGALGSFKTTANGATLTLTSNWSPSPRGACPVNVTQVSYVHADAHASIALQRPAGLPPLSSRPGPGVPGKPHIPPGSIHLSKARRAARRAEGAPSRQADLAAADYYDVDAEMAAGQAETSYMRSRRDHPGGHYNYDDTRHAHMAADQDVWDNRGPVPRPDIYDILLGTDGGLFLSIDGGNTYDNGLVNIGISTMLATALVSTPLNRNMMMVGLQDNGSRLRIGTSTAWDPIQSGDGQGQFLSQGGTIATGTCLSIANWYKYPVDGVSLEALNATQPTGNGDPIQGGTFAADGGVPTGSPDMDGDFGIPTANVDPTGQVVFTRKTSGLYRSSDAGRTWTNVHVFPASSREADGGEPDVYIELDSTARWHNIAVAPARSGVDTLSVAVVRPRTTLPVTTNWVDVATDQGADNSTTWTSASTEDIPNWVDTRLASNGTTASPAWRSNDRVYVSSVALPSPELSPPRMRVAFADVTDAGIGAFTACAAANLPDTPVIHVVVDDSGTLYAATWQGVWVSIDNCATFAQLGSGLPNVQVTALSLLPAGNGQPKLLRAATFGRGVWELSFA